MQIEIRPYQSSDFNAVVQLIEFNILTYFAAEEKIDFITYLKDKIEYYFVVIIDQQVIGAGGINVFNQKTCRISWDIIHPDYQGKGIGKQLLQFRLAFIRTSFPKHEIIVRTSQMAYRFYLKNNFKIIQKKRNYWAEGIDLVTLKKY